MLTDWVHGMLPFATQAATNRPCRRRNYVVTLTREVPPATSTVTQDRRGNGDDFGCGNDDPHHVGGGPAGSGDSSAAGEGDARAREVRLDNVHTLINEYVGAEVLDGENLRLAPEALRSPYFPWMNLTEQLVSVWSLTTCPSRRSLQLLLDLLRYKHRLGRRFNPDDVPKLAEHLISRARERFPLLRLVRHLGGGEGWSARANC